MAGVPVNFQAFSNVLANYDFVDIASGTGYIKFYAGKTVDLALLSNFSYYANPSNSDSGTFTGGVSRIVLDVDFDVLLNRPLDLKGTAIVNVPFYYNSGGNVSIWYLKILVRKWDGATETEVASNDSIGYSTSGAPYNGYQMTATDVTIPLTHYKKGETLRLTIQVWGYTTGGVNCQILISHDPAGRTWDGTGAVSSKLEFQCPVRLNL
jgi:hypothetical protein